MALLVTYAQQSSIKAFGGLNSTNQVAINKYDQLAEEVESYEIDLLLGTAFYQDISNNPTDTKYVNLLDGSEFEDCNGNTVSHKGLRYVIAYLNFAQWMEESHINDTWTGFVQKQRQDSELISKGDRKNLYVYNREIAMNAFSLIKEFLDLNTDIYELWKCSISKKITTPKFYGVKKTRG